MKTFICTLIALLMALGAIAQTKFWVYKDDGNTVEFEIAHTDSISFTAPKAPSTVKDICNNTYPVVTIGTQTWMAENYRCSKYDTQSEAYNVKWLTNNTIPTSNDRVYTPYYTDASDKSKWYETTYAGNLTDAQVAKLGYLYNWAAAVGVEDGMKYDKESYIGRRQGICPNGWHIPSKSEWRALYDYIYNDLNLLSNTVGKYLKTTSGWYSGDLGLGSFSPGTDFYKFAALPAGSASGNQVTPGVNAHYWATTECPTGEASDFNLLSGINSADSNCCYKNSGHSVRCLKN